jgi:hypothetical protein
MKLLHKTSAIHFYLLHTGFLSFKRRLSEILSATSGLTLEDYIDDESLCTFYRNGDSPEYIAAAIIGPDMEFDSASDSDYDEEMADAG